MTENSPGSCRLKKLEPIHERAALLLMQRGSVAAVAQELDVHPTTVSNWKKSPRFMRYYRKLRRDAYDDAASVLQAASLKAVGKLIEAIDWDAIERPDLALQAASRLLDMSKNWVDGVDMVERLERVERKLKKQEN